MPRYVRIVLGSVFLVMGVVGLALPVLQRLLFIVVGVLLLARDIPLFARIAERFRSRFPRITLAAENTRKRVGGWSRRRPWFGNR